jgi:hypothetical protein
MISSIKRRHDENVTATGKRKERYEADQIVSVDCDCLSHDMRVWRRRVGVVIFRDYNGKPNDDDDKLGSASDG